jgi:AP2-like factor, euAP2 lineage
MSSLVKIPVSPNQYALVDQADAEMVKCYRWHITAAPKSRVHIYGKRIGYNKTPGINLARLIAQAKGAEMVTFRNNNPLDCRRENLLVVDLRKDIGRAAQHDRHKRPGTTSIYVGVSRKAGKGGLARQWTAYIRVSGRFIYLGRYATEEEAARAYDVAALEHFGPGAKLNFPDRVGEPPPSSFLEITCSQCGKRIKTNNPRQKRCGKEGCELKPEDVRSSFESIN